MAVALHAHRYQQPSCQKSKTQAVRLRAFITPTDMKHDETCGCLQDVCGFGGFLMLKMHTTTHSVSDPQGLILLLPLFEAWQDCF